MKSALGPILALALLAGAFLDWTQRSWRIAVAMGALTLAAAIWAVAAREVRWTRQMLIVAPLSLWASAQLLARSSVVPWRTEHDAALWALCGVAFVLGSQILSSRSARHAFLDTLMWGGAVLAVIGMLQYYASPGKVYGIFPVVGGEMGPFHYRNQFDAFMELTGGIALWRIRFGNPVSGSVCFALMLAAALTSTSRSGLVLMSVELLAFLVIASFGRGSTSQTALRTVIFVLFAAGAVAVAGAERTLERFGQEAISSDVRALFDRSTIEMIRERPWTGFGMGTWSSVYPRFATVDQGLIANEAHDDWLQWAEEGGIPFALLMAALVIWLAKPAVDSVWGLGILIVMAHSAVDYLLRDPVLGFTWFSLAGALAVWRKE